MVVRSTWDLSAAILILVSLTSQASADRASPSPAALESAGIRRVVGNHLTLYTDLPASVALGDMLELFDRAVPHWGKLLGTGTVADTASWHMDGHLIQEADRFQRIGLMPRDLPPFPHGYQRGDKFWLYDQPSDYYRRHLVLHEGTHGFCELLGAFGLTDWYREGIAEWFATHRWESGTFVPCTFPADRDEVPNWGRIRLVQDDVENDRYLTLRQVLAIRDPAFRRTGPYGWCWAAVVFLESHPASAAIARAFRERLPRGAKTVSQSLQRELAPVWGELEDDWGLFVHRLDYGDAIANHAIRHPSVAPRPIPAEGLTVSVKPQHGWLNTGLRIREGETYQLHSSGRYVINRDPTPWWSDANGVTIEYADGRPLGALLVAVAPDRPGQRWKHLMQPTLAGTKLQLASPRSGVLFLRINGRPVDIPHMSGELTVRIEATSTDR